MKSTKQLYLDYVPELDTPRYLAGDVGAATGVARGTLKAWLYAPIVHTFGTGPIAVRLPMVLAGALSVWLFFLLLRRVHGLRAALLGCGLLACDGTYLLTNCFDWGPVALQHVLLIGGILLIIPGVLTDLFALVLLIPYTRTIFKRWLRRRFDRMVASGNVRLHYYGRN